MGWGENNNNNNENTASRITDSNVLGGLLALGCASFRFWDDFAVVMVVVVVGSADLVEYFFRKTSSNSMDLLVELGWAVAGIKLVILFITDRSSELA